MIPQLKERIAHLELNNEANQKQLADLANNLAELREQLQVERMPQVMPMQAAQQDPHAGSLRGCGSVPRY